MSVAKAALNEHGLTDKQEAFAVGFVRLGNASQAYREAYDVKSARRKSEQQWVHVEACTLLDHPKVSLRIEGLREAESKRLHYGIKEAFDRLEEIREKSVKRGAFGAAASSVKHQMTLFGLGSKNLNVNGEVSLIGETPEDHAQAWADMRPIFIDALRAEGFAVIAQAELDELRGDT